MTKALEKRNERKSIPFGEGEIKFLLSVIDGKKSFRDLDKKQVFISEKPNKGTLGHVIEESILGIPKNSFQNADIQIAYADKIVPTEVKTTGVHDRELRDDEQFHAKECVTLTAVSIDTIADETTWEESHFYEKIAHMLWFFYFYKREKGEVRVPYEKYDRFPVLGYKFTHLEDFSDDYEKFKSDWNLTRNFIIEANKTAKPEQRYPMLHSEIKKDLFYIDIAPRYKKVNGKVTQEPRFRIKKPYVNLVFQRFWKEKNDINMVPPIEEWEKDCNSFDELEERLYNLTKCYQNKTIEQIAKMLGIPTSSRWPKSITEQIFLKMIRSSSGKISNIDLFNRIGIIPKTITITQNGKKTEDTKLFTIDLDEICDDKLRYIDTSYYHYFNDYQFLCVIFEENKKNASLGENIFKGIKRLVFPDFQMRKLIREPYKITCDLIRNHKVVEKYCYKNGKKIKNPNGTFKTSLNFPKAAKFHIFVRGTGPDSSYKSWILKGKSLDNTGCIKSYPLQFWIRGSFITELLKDVKYIGS